MSPASSRRRRGVASGEVFYSPGSVHRLDWIFASPRFTIDGYSSSDIQQGANGDCWWLAAVATIAHRPDLMARVCVARDEECGAYGFVFQRDGEWVPAVVDDNLYLAAQDYGQVSWDEYDPTGAKARRYRAREQAGSEALYFSRCADPNETWLPLMEKAYAKVHGDYEAIYGGWGGEAVEDMTGGVTTTVSTRRVLSKEKLWHELARSDGDFVFALSALGAVPWVTTSSGVQLNHAYSVLKATEEVGEDGHRVRLVQIRNPWGARGFNGVGEWNGRWSDGSREWTPYWLKKLNYSFGDDGVFWMLYEDMLETFKFLHRTRLFDGRWTTVQQWTSANISYITGYLQTKFVIDVKKAGMVVVVLAQLDDRYFVGLEGQYEFALHFLLQKEGAPTGEHICRVRPVHSWEKRSVSCEVELEPGRYEVLPKVTATRNKDATPVEEVVKTWAEKNPQKMRQIGMQYDLAHAKGGIQDEDLILQQKKAEQKRKREEEKRIAKEEARKAEEAAKSTEDAAPALSPSESAAGETQKVEAEKKPEGAAPKENATKETEADKFEDATETQEEKANAGKKEEKKKAAPWTNPDGTPAGGPLEPEKKKDDEDDKKKGHHHHHDKKDDKRDDNKKDEKKDEKKEDEKKEDEKKEEDKDGSAETEAEEDSDDDGTRWNAVCVMCLRVYSQDPGTTISLVKPKNEEEAATLTVEDKTPAGATM